MFFVFEIGQKVFIKGDRNIYIIDNIVNDDYVLTGYSYRVIKRTVKDNIIPTEENDIIIEDQKTNVTKIKLHLYREALKKTRYFLGASYILMAIKST